MSYQQRRQQTQNFLKPLQYQNKQGAEHQINQLLHQINSLNPTVDNYVYNNGAEAALFKLYGTIPIIYRGQQYNIPVAFWFPLNFPQNPPICYVKPVQGMKVKAKHKHVDSQGLIYHPYLHGWAKNVNHSLVDLIGILCSEFGKDPPLYSQRGGGGGGGNSGANVAKKAQPPSYGAQKAYYQPYGSQGYHGNGNGNIKGGGGNGGGGNGVNGNYGVVNGHRQNQGNNGNDSIGNKDSKMSETDLRSRVEDKLRVQLQIVYDRENSELQSLANKRKELESRKGKIDSIKDRLEQENALLVARASDLEKKISSLEGWLKENEDNQDMNVSKVILACDTWSEQCMKAVAEDFGYTDVMRELDKELEDETLKLDQYMKVL